MFGSFALRANSLGHLEQIGSYAPGHQDRFGNLNYTADIRRDLIFNGFGPVPGAPNNHDSTTQTCCVTMLGISPLQEPRT